MSAPASDPVVAFVMLRGGPTIPVDALLLAWSLEERGAVLGIDGDQLVVDGPAGFLTDADRRSIRRWRDHLKAIISYRAPEVVE